MQASDTKLVFPGLSGFYSAMLPVALAFKRVVVGAMFLMHVIGKFNAGPAAVSANIFAKSLFFEYLFARICASGTANKICPRWQIMEGPSPRRNGAGRRTSSIEC
jgi:hypothetical protein